MLSNNSLHIYLQFEFPRFMHKDINFDVSTLSNQVAPDRFALQRSISST